MKFIGFENLEPRRLLSASLNDASHLLTVTGTAKNDMIRVAIGGVNLKVTINGLTSSFPLKKVGSILIDALGGNDDVDIKNEIVIPATIHGGQGNDKLGGGGGADVIDGGLGADVIAGGPGVDLADYSARTSAVTVGIGGLADDGEAGEHDNVQFDIEQIAGGSGKDKLTGSGLNNTLIGNGGADLLIGGGGNDSLEGSAGDDTLRGGSGDDTFAGGDDSDWADYSDHDSQASAVGGGTNINLDDTADSGLMKNFQQVEFDTIHTDVENVIGSAGQDFISAIGDVANKINARGGDDFITPGDGDDTVDAGAGDDQVLGGNGNDLLIGGSDTLAAGQSDKDFLVGEDGDDSIIGGADNDTIIGSVGDDIARGGDGNDEIFGEENADSLFGDDGNDSISGGVGDDSIEGGDGVDSLSGDDDNDYVQDGGTILPDNSQVETIDDSLGSASQNISPLDIAVDPDAIDTLDGGTGGDTLVGGAGQAFLFGSDGDDHFIGGAGSEAISGGLGNDSVDAGGGEDTVTGGFGLDTLNGDAGNDIFVNNDGQADTIDGGDDIDFVQFEQGGVDIITNNEGIYDQPDAPPAPLQSNGPTQKGNVAGSNFANANFASANSSSANSSSANSSSENSSSANSSSENFISPNFAGATSDSLVPDDSEIIPAAVAAAPYSISGGTLTISGELDGSGAAMNDNISLSQSGSTLTLIENGNTYQISATGLKGIFIDAGSGSDFVALATSTGKSTIGLAATISGGRGDDVLRGGNGNDILLGGLGNDALSGNNGNDALNGGSDVQGQDADGRDTLLGGAGTSDTARYDSRSTPLSLSLDGVANDGASGEGDMIGSDIENVFAGRGNDTITGNSAANFLTGGPGADVIHGGGGNDKIVASCASDTSDTVYGEAGTDLILLAGDKSADRYNVGAGELESALFVTKDAKTGGGFLDVPF